MRIAWMARVWLCAVALTSSVAALGCGDEPTSTIPAPLVAIESGAEDAYDHALAGDRAALEQDLAQLAGAWSSFRTQASADGASQASVADMDVAIEGLRAALATEAGPVALARAANALGAPMDQLFAVYRPAVPPAVLELDYLGREVVLDAREADFDRARRDLDAITSTWGTLRPAVIAAGGAVQAADFDASIETERTAVTASDAPGLETSATNQLELVDAIEGVFPQTGDVPD